MAKSDPNKIEFHPDAMQRFERAVSVVAKSQPQHRVEEESRDLKKAGFEG